MEGYAMAKGRTNPGDVANLLVRCLLADASEVLGTWNEADRERTLRFFGRSCAYTGQSLDGDAWVWDHLVPHNRDACGLHVYGNLVPATRKANSAKGDRDFRDFLRGDRSCLGDLPLEDRESRIRRLEDFQAASGYDEKAEAVSSLRGLCAEQYERIKEICRENREALRGMLGARVVSRAPTANSQPARSRRRDGTLTIEYEVEPPARFLQHFLKAGMAYIEEHYIDGRVRLRPWPVVKLREDSNLINNIRSKPEYRQGAWQSAGIFKLVLRLTPLSLQASDAREAEVVLSD